MAIETKQFQTPILLIVFNRIDTLQVLFDAIKAQKPKYLYVAGDGARPHVAGEAEKVRQARAIVEQVDWDCEVKTFFSETNSGSAAVGVTRAISWFFEQVEYGIIFEHDCIPHPDHFQFCEACLEKYKTDESVCIINGVNFQNGQKRGNASYYFSATGTSTWGFATWRRFWQHYDVTLANYSYKQFKKDARFYNFTWKERLIRNDRYKLLKTRKTNDWTYQTGFAVSRLHGLQIVPNVNLISNIGGGEAAHGFKDKDNWRLNRATFPILPIVHPSKVERNTEADAYQYRRVTLRPTIYIPGTAKSVEVNINSFLLAILYFAWRWLRRNFIEKPKY
ncbi:hemolytic protein HlpA [Bacteroidia bacterium]|nr:hemolytic protein HlpA [Bacteroidia bacterium]